MIEKTYKIQHDVMQAYCDHRGEARLSYFLAMAQQISMAHCDSAGIGDAFFRTRGMAFLMAKLRLEIERTPLGGERLELFTEPNLPTKAQYRRRTTFFAGGSVIARMDARWVLVDTASRKLLRRVPQGLELPFLDAEELPDFRPSMPDNLTLRETATVRYSMIDVNGHLNNTVYADLICNMLERELLGDKRLRTVEIFYHHEAMPGAGIDLWLAEQNDNFYIRGTVENSPCFEAQGTLETV